MSLRIDPTDLQLPPKVFSGKKKHPQPALLLADPSSDHLPHYHHCTHICVSVCVCVACVFVLLTGAGLLVLVEFEALIAVAGEGSWSTQADLLTVVFPLSTQVDG